MTRITSGTSKGRRLKVPSNNGKSVSVQEKAKLAVFSVIGNKILNAKVADLYAGSGNLGIEALSRGAKFCDFIDESHESIGTIKSNLKLAELDTRADVYKADVLKFLSTLHRNYDVVFADPYYDSTSHKHFFKLAVNVLKPQGLLVLFTSDKALKPIAPAELNLIKEGRYGQTLVNVWILQIQE